MVRVISTHHFANQNVQVIEQPTACTIAHPDKLLLALSSHSVEVRNLNDHGEVLFTFPTVDEVAQIVHCLNGNFIATLESKFNRQNKEINFVRVYLNWDNLATMQQSKMTNSGVSLTTSECGMVQPMRARIAGRVTPTTNQSELGNLEMIEIPVKRNPQQINVCQISGNLIIQMNKSITIYTFEIKTHDISKLKFIDFEELPFTVDLCFYPREIHLAENYFACSNGDTFHMFKIVNKQQKDVLIANELNSEYSFHYNQNDKPIDYSKLLKNESLNLTKEKITVNLPMIIKENSIIHKYCPFTFSDKEIKATIKFSSNMETNVNFKSNYEIEDLVQLRLKPIVVECAQKQVTEEFKCLTLKPLYIKPNLIKTQKNNDINNTLKSLHRHLLHSVACIITTQQEGYLYQFYDPETTRSVDHCIAIYPFTAPIYKIVLENHFLHALTETGLETYTLRIGHELFKHLEVIDNENLACPSVQESVCLMGLRPFLGVEEILISENHLLLLANSDSSPTHSVSSSGSSTSAYWTLYDLELPSAKTVFNDISIVANSHRFTSSQTYCHLMNEGHVILRLNLVLNKWSFNENANVNLVVCKEMNNDDLIEAYRTCCALLADHYVMCLNKSDFILSVPYYKMGKIYPLEVLNRIKKIQEQCNNNNTKGLLHYLKTILLDPKSSLEIEKLYTTNSKQIISEKIIDLFEKHSIEDLPNLILKSTILRQHSTDKLISILGNKRSENASNAKNPEKSFALALLYVKKRNYRKAEDVLALILKEDLSKMIKDNHELLFEESVSTKSRTLTFSDLSILMMTVYPKMTSEIFVGLIVERKVITFHKMLKIFLEYLPSSIGTDATTTGREVLEKTLEMYFTSYFSKFDEIELNKLVLDWSANEGLKLLIRSYLSDLQILQIKEKNVKKEIDVDKDVNTKEMDDENRGKSYFEERKSEEKPKFLFSNFRYDYLDKMPPFQPEITSKLYQASLNESKNTTKENGKSQNEIKNSSNDTKNSSNESKKSRNESKKFTNESNKSPTNENYKNPKADFVLTKLQAILCSPIANKHILVDLVVFLDMNENLRGHLSMLSIISLVNEAVSLLVEKCPQCLLQFGKDRFTKLDEWKHLIATIQNKIIRLFENKDQQHVCFFYKKILKDVLTHVATSMNLEQLLQVFPQKLNTTSVSENVLNPNEFDCEPIINLDDIESLLKHSNTDGNVLNEIQNYEPYITMCKETMHANQIRKLITTTGQQLLCTLNL